MTLLKRDLRERLRSRKKEIFPLRRKVRKETTMLSMARKKDRGFHAALPLSNRNRADPGILRKNIKWEAGSGPP